MQITKAVLISENTRLKKELAKIKRDTDREIRAQKDQIGILNKMADDYCGQWKEAKEAFIKIESAASASLSKLWGTEIENKHLKSDIQSIKKFYQNLSIWKFIWWKIKQIMPKMVNSKMHTINAKDLVIWMEKASYSNHLRQTGGNPKSENNLQ